MTTINQEVLYSSFPINLTGILDPISPGYDWEWGWTEHDDSWDGVDDTAALRDTTGWAAEMDLRDSNSKLIKKLSTATGEITNDNSGKFAVTLLAAASVGISVRQLNTNVKVTDGSGKISNHFEASIEVKQVWTR